MKLKTPVLYAVDLAAGALAGYILAVVLVPTRLAFAGGAGSETIYGAAMLAFAFIPAGAAAFAFARWRLKTSTWVSLVALVSTVLVAGLLRRDEPWPEAAVADASRMVARPTPLEADDSTIALEGLYKGSTRSRVPEISAELFGRRAWYSEKRNRRVRLTPFVRPGLKVYSPAAYRRLLEREADLVRERFQRSVGARALIDELSRFETLNPPVPERDHRFRTVDSAAGGVRFVHIAYADLLAIEGDGDAAAEIALRLLGIARAIDVEYGERGTASLIRGDFETHALSSLVWILTEGEVSDETAGRIREALGPEHGPHFAAAAGRRAAAAELVWAAAVIGQLRDEPHPFDDAEASGERREVLLAAVFHPVLNRISNAVRPALFKPGRALSEYVDSFDKVMFTEDFRWGSVYRRSLERSLADLAMNPIAEVHLDPNSPLWSALLAKAYAHTVRDHRHRARLALARREEGR